MKNRMGGMLLTCVLAVLEIGPAWTAENKDWPCWQGPKGDSRSTTTGIKKDWTGGLKKIWEVGKLCSGNESDTWSSPVVKGDKLVVLGRADDKDVVFCFDATKGNELWKKDYQTGYRGGSGSGAGATPYIDGSRVYTFGRLGHIACWDLKDGKQVWLKTVKDDGGEYPEHGTASSPLVYGDMVIVEGGGGSQTIAYNKNDGTVVWKSGKGYGGYAAITMAKLDGKDQIIVFNGEENRDKGKVVGLDPKTGKEIWRTGWSTPYGNYAVAPVFSGHIGFLATGFGAFCKAFEVKGDKAADLWQNNAVCPHISEPIIIDEYVYCYSGDPKGKGELKCLELKTGKQMWSAGNQVGWGTFVHVDGHLLCLSNKGDLFLVKPDPKEFKKVTEFKGAIPGDPVWSVPVIVSNRLYLRCKDKLVCYDLKN